MRAGINAFCLMLFFLFVPPLLFAGPAGRLSPAAQENLNRVNLTLESLSIPFETRSLLAGYGGFGSSVITRAGDGSPGTFVLAIPLEADFAVDTGLALAEKTLFQNSPVNIIIAFLGNERNILPPELGGLSHKGLRDLLTLADTPESWVLCYLDIVKSPEGLLLRHGATGYVTPLDILRPLTSALRSHEIPWSFRVRYNNLYKLGLTEGHEALSIIWREEVNGFVLAGKNGPSKTFLHDHNGESVPDGESGELISPRVLAELLFEYAGSLNFPMMNLDKHYFFFTAPWGEIVFFGEGITVALLLIMAGLYLFFLLLYSTKYNAILLFHTRLFFKSVWVFVLLFVFLVLSIRASGFFYSMLLRAFGPSAPLGMPPEIYFTGTVLTLLLAILVFFLHSPVFAMIRLPRRAQFYGFSSVILVTIGLLTAAFLDFSFVPAFLWAFAFGFFASAVSRPIPVLLCVVMIPLLAVDVLRNITETGSTILAEFFISTEWRTLDSWLPAILVALFSLPLILLIKRGIILVQKLLHRESKPKSEYRLIVVSVLIFVVLTQMIAHLLLIPRDKVPPERRFIAEEPATANGILTLSLDNMFQDPHLLTLQIGARGNPVRFDVFLEAANGLGQLPVYSAPVPFQRGNNGSWIQFMLGEFPPNPLSLEIVLPRHFAGLLRAEAVFNTWDPAIDPGEEPGTEDYILRVSRTIELGR